MDSVRNSRAEIEHAQWALFEEVARNGNIAVLTFNQIVDSEAFVKAILDERTRGALLEHFKAGRIRYSCYGSEVDTEGMLPEISGKRDASWYANAKEAIENALEARGRMVTSPSQYLQSSLKKGLAGQYVFSALDLNAKNDFDKEIMLDMLSALTKSDTSILESKYYEEANADNPEKTRVSKREAACHYVKAIEIISLLPLARHDRAGGTPATLEEYLKCSDQIESEAGFVPLLISQIDTLSPTFENNKYKKQFEDAKSRVSEIKDELLELLKYANRQFGTTRESKGINNRSEWYEIIRERAATATGDSCEQAKAAELLEAIVDICYNYVCERNIKGISRHAYEDDIVDWGADLLIRIGLYLESGHLFLNDDDRASLFTFECKPTNKAIPFTERQQLQKQGSNDSIVMPPWQHSATMITGIKLDRRIGLDIEITSESAKTYGDGKPYLVDEASLSEWRKLTRFDRRWVVALALAFFLVIALYDHVVEAFGDWVGELDIPAPAFLSLPGIEAVVGALALIVALLFFPITVAFINEALDRGIGALLDKSFSKPGDNAKSRRGLMSGYSWPGLVEAIKAIQFYRLFGPYKNITGKRATWTGNSYSKEGNARKAQNENKDESSLPRLMPFEAEWNIYDDLKKQRKELFENSEDIGSINIVTDEEAVAAFERQNMAHIGVLTDSPYYQHVVDLVESSNGRRFTYERIIPKANNSVVVIPKIGDKYALLRQYRHATRSWQLCFPRGFGEEELDGPTNADKELSEELGVSPSSIEFLGAVTPDSGISATKALVYACDIDHVVIKEGYEGIKDSIQCNAAELNELISSGEIDDGFTLSAWALLGSRKASL